MNYSYYNNLYNINEAYIGKTETLKEIEKQIGIIRKRALIRFTDISRSPEVLKLNRLFEKQFGMECFSLFINQESIANAYTIMIQRRFDVAFKKNISKYVEGNQNTGYRWKKDNGLCININIYLGMLENDELTDAEILAILLHELGHNFADAIYDDIKYANISFMYALIWLIIIDTITHFPTKFADLFKLLEFPLTLNNEFRLALGKIKIQNPFRGILQGFYAMRSDILQFVNGVINLLVGKGAITNTIIKYIHKFTGEKEYQRTKSLDRQNEVIADKFAAIYGYGPELISALKKMDDYKTDAVEFVEYIPFLGKFMTDIFRLSAMDMGDYDCHGNLINRAYSEINLLKRELSKADIDPKMAKMMTEQLNELQDIVVDCMKYNADSSKYEKARALYYKLINDECPTGITEKIEDEIEEAFDRALKKK